jgi:hypothetical protein
LLKAEKDIAKFINVHYVQIQLAVNSPAKATPNPAKRQSHTPFAHPFPTSSHTLTDLHLFRRLTIHKSQCLFPAYSVNATRLVVECDTVALIRNKQHLGSESRANKLSAHATCSVLGVLATLLSGDFLQHLSNSCTVLGVEVCIDFVK